MDCLESLALNVSTDFASMNYIHFAKVLRTLLAPRSNHWQGFALCGSHPRSRKTWKKRLEQMFSLFFKVTGQGWIRTTVPSREQIYSLSPLATRPPTHINFSKNAFDEIWTRGLSLTKGVRYPCATKACLAFTAPRPPRSATSHKKILNLFVRQSPCATKDLYCPTYSLVKEKSR